VISKKGQKNADETRLLQGVGIASNTTMNEIKNAYRRLAFQYHPDRNQSDQPLTGKWKISMKPMPRSLTRLNEENMTLRWGMGRSHQSLVQVPK